MHPRFKRIFKTIQSVHQGQLIRPPGNYLIGRDRGRIDFSALYTYTAMAAELEEPGRDKKPFISCVQGIPEDLLKTQLCDVVYGDLIVLPEVEWIILECSERRTLQTPLFGETLGLSEDEVRSVIHTAPRSKEQQLKLAVIAWSKHSNEATLEKLLEALYTCDEVELVEDICRSSREY